MAENVLALWTYQAREEIFTMAVTDDGRLIFAGGHNALYCFERTGRLIWRNNLEGLACSIALAEGSERMLVGCSSGKAYLWSYQGRLLHVLETTGAIFNLDLTPTASHMVLGTRDGVLSLYDASCHQLWNHTLPRAIRRLALSADGTTLVLGCDDHAIYCFQADGTQRWRVQTGARVWAGATLSSTGSCVLGGSNDQHVYLLDRAGHLLWRQNTGSEVNALALTADGRLAAAAGNGKTLWLWKQNGELLWKATTPGEVYGLNLSEDGCFVTVGTDQGAVVLFDEQGQALWTEQMRGKVYSVAMTPTGRFIAAVAADHTISLVENRLAEEEAEEWEALRLIRQVREQVVENEHLGIANWFESFDGALRERRLQVSERLMQEMREGGYALQKEELRWVESREGTLWLYQGLRHLLHEEKEQAKQAFDRSLERQRQLRYLQGEGQAMIALRTLESTQADRDPNLLALLTSPSEVIGDSEKLLEQRLKYFPAIMPQHELVLTSRRLGYLQPLLAAQSSPHMSVQGAAAAGMYWLNPGPPIITQLDLLTSSAWIVRWQAALMLTARAEKDPRGFAAYRERVRQLVNKLLRKERDPEVIRWLVVLLRMIGDSAQVDSLLPLLKDSEPDVRLETIITLGQIGTRRVLESLRHVNLRVDGHDPMEQQVSDWSALARHMIRQRIPLAEVQQVICSPVLNGPRPTQSTEVFLTYNPEIHCFVNLTHVTAGLRVQCIIKTEGQEPFVQEQQTGIPPLENEQQQDSHRSLRDWLYRLLAEEDEVFWLWREDEEEIGHLANDQQAKEFVFSFIPARRTWFPGIYTVEISLNGLVKYKHFFKIVSREGMFAAPYYYSKGLFFHHQKLYQEAFLDYDQTLKFDAHHVDALCNTGDVLLVQGLYKEASGMYARALQLDVTSTFAHFCLEGPLHLLEMNRPEEVLATLCQATITTIDPNAFSDSVALLTDVSSAIITLQFDDRERANSMLVQAVQSIPNSLCDLFGQIVGLFLIDRKEEGLAALGQLKSRDINAKLGAIFQSVGLAMIEQREEALSVLDRALYESPNALSLLTTKAILQIIFERREEALAVLEQAQGIEPNSVLLAAIKGVDLYLLDRPEDVLTTSQHIIDFNPQLTLAHLLRSVMLVLLRRYEEALELLDRLLLTFPDCIPAYLLQIYVCAQLKLDERALSQCEQVIQRLPDFSYIYFIQGQLLLRLDQVSASLEAFERAGQLGLATTPLATQAAIALESLAKKGDMNE